MSRSDSPEGGQGSGGYKSKSPSPASLEAWRSNVTPDRLSSWRGIATGPLGSSARFQGFDTRSITD